MNMVIVIASLGILYFLAHVFSGIFNRTKIPDVLWLIIVGLLLGPVFGIVLPDRLGVAGPVLVTVTLIVILFESGLSISLATLVKAWTRGVFLTVLNFVATAIVVGIAVLLLTDLTPLTAFMLGSIVGGTSSAVVIPLIRQIELREQSSAIVLFESALSDVLCIVVALAFIDAYNGKTTNLALMAGGIIASFVVAIILGIAGAALWSVLLSRIRNLQNSIFATPFFVFIIFGLAEFLGFNGYIAALAFGIAIGNMNLLQSGNPRLRMSSFKFMPASLNETEKKVFAEMVFLLKTFFFVYVGILIRLTDARLLWVGLILTVLIFILRIPVIRLSISRVTPIKDVSIMAVLVPKGLAAAALASLPLQQGVAGGETIQDITFAVVLFSIVMTSILIFLVHKTSLSKVYQRMFLGFGMPSAPVVEGPNLNGVKTAETPQIH